MWGKQSMGVRCLRRFLTTGPIPLTYRLATLSTYRRYANNRIYLSIAAMESAPYG